MEPTNIWVKYCLFLIALFTVAMDANSKAIIWDFGDTLVSISKFGMATEVGLSDFFFSSIFDKYSQELIQDDIFYFLNLESNAAAPKILSATKFPQPRQSDNKQRKYHPKSSDGKLLPQIMCDWLEGKVINSEISSNIKLTLNQQYKSGYFRNDMHKRIVQNSINTIFNPQILANNMYIIKPALYLLAKSVRQIDNTGKPKHDMFILSNLDVQTFDYFKNTYQANKILRYFKPDHIVLSGNIKIAKPNPGIYKYLLKKFRLDPKDCIFIDDQLENIETAKKLGIDALHIKDQNYYKLQKQLEFRKII